MPEQEEDFKEKLGMLLSGRSREEMVFIYENLSMMVRAFEGKAVEPKDAIDKLTNVRNIFERSRFPTYPILSQITYLRLLHHVYGDDAEICRVWAETLAENLIAYKGKGREEYRDMVKAASLPEGQNIIFGGQQQPKEKPRFLRRSKEEPQEFKE